MNIRRTQLADLFDNANLKENTVTDKLVQAMQLETSRFKKGRV